MRYHFYSAQPEGDLSSVWYALLDADLQHASQVSQEALVRRGRVERVAVRDSEIHALAELSLDSLPAEKEVHNIKSGCGNSQGTNLAPLPLRAIQIVLQ